MYIRLSLILVRLTLQVLLLPARLAARIAVAGIDHSFALFAERNTLRVRTRVGTLFAFVVGFLVGLLGFLSGMQGARSVSGWGDFSLRGVSITLLGQVAVYAFSFLASLRGWLRLRGHAVAVARSGLQKGLSGFRVLCSSGAWGGYAIAQFLDRASGGHHSGLVAITFLASPFYWFAWDYFRSVFARRQTAGQRFVQAAGGLLVGAMLVGGVVAMVSGEGFAVTLPVLISTGAGICQALRVLPQKLLANAGVPASVALAQFAGSSALLNAAALLALAPLAGVDLRGLVSLIPFLIAYGIVGALRQQMEQAAVSSPRRTAVVTLLTLSAPVSQYVLTGGWLHKWGPALQFGGGAVLLVAGVAFVLLDELVLRMFSGA